MFYVNYLGVITTTMPLPTAPRIVRAPEHPAWNPTPADPMAGYGTDGKGARPYVRIPKHTHVAILTSNMSTVAVRPTVRVASSKWRGEGPIDAIAFAERGSNQTSKVYANAGRNGRALPPKLDVDKARTESRQR